MRHLLLHLLLIAAPGLALAQSQMEIIPLRHRTLEQVLPVLQPLVEPGGTLSGMNDRLILRASAANRAEIRQALAAIDTPARRLMISVRHDNERLAEERGAEASGSLASGGLRLIQPGGREPAGTAVEIRRGDDAARVRVFSTRGQAEERIAQQVQVVEGGRAFIQVGSALPLPLRQLRAGPGGVVVTDTVVYRDVGTGFYAQPVVAGDRVSIEISPQQESLSTTAPGVIQSHRLATTVSGRLGEWIPLGASGLSQERDASGTLRYATRGGVEDRRVMLRVDELR